MSKKILFLSRCAPYGRAAARETLEAAMAATVYDQDVSLLFMDDGVFQLLSNQSPDELGQKSIAATLSALSLYGLEKVYAHQESLEQRGVTLAQLALSDIELLRSEQITTLLSQQDHILSF